MCEEIKLPVRAITVPMEAYLRGLSQLKTYANKTAIFLFFEDSGVTSILYKNGVYLYSTRSRIFSERGTLDFGTEIVRKHFRYHTVLMQRQHLESRLQTFIMQAVWRMILKYASMESI